MFQKTIVGLLHRPRPSALVQLLQPARVTLLIQHLRRYTQVTNDGAYIDPAHGRAILSQKDRSSEESIAPRVVQQLLLQTLRNRLHMLVLPEENRQLAFLRHFNDDLLQFLHRQACSTKQLRQLVHLPTA